MGTTTRTRLVFTFASLAVAFTNCSPSFNAGSGGTTTSLNSGSGGVPPELPIPLPTDGSKLYPVYPSCEEPASSYTRTVYVDPMGGDDVNGDGSQSKPYKMINATVTAKKIVPGDHVILLPGTHGGLAMSASSAPLFVNSTKWTWIESKAGAKLSTLSINGISRILVTGADISAPTGLLTYIASSNNIVFADGYIYGALDTSSWTIDQWKSAAGAFQFNNVKCGSLLRTRIKNVRGGIGILTPVDDTHMKNLLYGNEIRNFSADALVANASDLTVENNKFLDGYADQADGDGNHDDIIQIFALGGRVFDNIVIHNNYIADTTNLSRPWQSGYQGISCFDGIVTNIKITNNVVLASAYHGISLYGARGALIANNTVINSKANGRTNWIGIFNLKDGTPPQNVVSKDNLASGFAGNAPATSYTSTNNYTVSKPLETFVVYDLPTATFDLTLKPTSPFFGKGAGAY